MCNLLDKNDIGQLPASSRKLGFEGEKVKRNKYNF